MRLNKQLLGGSIILVVTFGIFNFLNYIYHLGMLRMLSVAEYGILATLLAIVYIISIFTESVQTVLAKYTAAEPDAGKVKNLFTRSLRKALFAACCLFALYALVALPLSAVMRISFPLMLLGGVIIFAMFATASARGVLQGRQRFRALGSTMMLEGAIKLVLGIALVYVGWKVYGALIGAILGTAGAFIYALFVLRPYLRAREKHVPTPRIYEYSWPVFLITLTILVFYNIDVIIAKIVFDEQTAGLYAITAVIAKTIFFATQPISRAMFSMTAQSAGRPRQKSVFRSSLLILSACIVGAFALLFFFPEFVIKIFTGKAIPEVAYVLKYAAIAASLLSLANLFILYRLSQGKIGNPLVFLTFIILEALLLILFSANLVQFVLAFMTSAAIFLWGSVVLLRE